MYSIHARMSTWAHTQQYTNRHQTQFLSQFQTPVCQSSNSVLTAFPWSNCVWAAFVLICHRVCVLVVWQPQIRWQLSYHAEPTYSNPHKPQVSACWLFTKHTPPPPQLHFHVNFTPFCSLSLPSLPSVFISWFPPSFLCDRHLSPF